LRRGVDNVRPLARHRRGKPSGKGKPSLENWEAIKSERGKFWGEGENPKYSRREKAVSSEQEKKGRNLPG